MRRLGVMLFEQPARTSNKFEMWTKVPEALVTVVSDREGWGADRTIVCEVARLPLLGGTEAWTAAPAMLRGVNQIPADDIDVVASHELYSFTTFQAARFAKQHGLPHVVHISETMPRNIVYWLPPYALIARRTVRSASWFVCTTERARQHAIALGCDGDRATVVHSGIDLARFHPAPDGPVEANEVLFVGMLRANRGADKGVRELVAAGDILAAEGLAFRIRIVGDGHLREELEMAAATRPFLEVVGRIPRDEIPALMRSSRVFVLPSKRTWKWEEQFGFVLAEAMASGIPVVSTTCGSIPEIVEPGNDLVIQGDPIALADAIRRALGPGAAERGAANRAWAEDHFDLGRQAARIRGALDSALEREDR